jgi:hypothetical protein
VNYAKNWKDHCASRQRQRDRSLDAQAIEDVLLKRKEEDKAMENHEYERDLLNVKAYFAVEVAKHDDLTPKQQEKVMDIAFAYVLSHSGQLPNVSGIADAVRRGRLR